MSGDGIGGATFIIVVTIFGGIFGGMLWLKSNSVELHKQADVICGELSRVNIFWHQDKRYVTCGDLKVRPLPKKENK